MTNTLESAFTAKVSTTTSQIRPDQQRYFTCFAYAQHDLIELMNIEEVRAKIKRGEYDLSAHAHIERQVEHITIKEIESTIFSGEIIERYPKILEGCLS